MNYKLVLAIIGCFGAALVSIGFIGQSSLAICSKNGVCAGNGQASTGPATNPGQTASVSPLPPLAGTQHPDNNPHPTLATSGSIACGGKPAAIINGLFLCSG